MKPTARLFGVLVGCVLLGSTVAFVPPLSSPVPRGRPLRSTFSPDTTNPPSGVTEAVVREWDRVELRVYDISMGYKDMLAAVLQKPVEGIWHVGVAVYGKEYWFSTLIESKALEDTEFAFGMTPKAVYDLGRTTRTVEEFERHLEEELSDKFQVKNYNVFENNCNHFANDAIKFLTGGSGKLPGYVLELSDNALDRMPKGQASLTRMITNQAARVVMVAWGRATRSKEEIAKRDAKKGLLLYQNKETEGVSK